MAESSLDFLGRFCAWFGQVIEPANKMRLAILAHDPALANNAVIVLNAATDRFAAECVAANEFVSNEREWWFEHEAWKHGGQHGDEPAYPTWPQIIPQFREALEVVGHVDQLRQHALGWIAYLKAIVVERRPPPSLHGHMFVSELQNLINSLNNLISLAEIENERGRDGPIDRIALAKLVNVRPKTLANRASELPAPIARTSKDVPIYLYQPAKHALKEMYPDRAGTLPDTYQEAISRSE